MTHSFLLFSSTKMMVLLTSRFDAMEQGQQGALSQLAQLLDDMHDSISCIEIQTAEIKAISVNQMQVLTQLFNNKSDVPRFFLIYKKEHHQTFLGALNKAAYSLKTLGGTKCKLVILCECCMAPVPCGPKKNGFSVNVPSKTLVKMAPALLLGLKFFVVAVRVAAGTAGVKLPLPSFATIDALQETLDQVQELVGNSLVSDVSAFAASAFELEAPSVSSVSGLAADRVASISDDTASSLATASGRIQEAAGDAYKNFKALLQSHDPSAQFYGESPHARAHTHLSTCDLLFVTL